VTLARRFNPGERVMGGSRRVAMTDFSNILKLFLSRRDATKNVSLILPGVETPG